MKELEDMRNDELLTVIIAGIQILRDNEHKQGYADGKADTPFTDTEEAENKAYNRGLNEAWDAAKKANEIDADVYDKLFPKSFIDGIYESYTAREVIDKLAEYEDKQKQDAEIKVGDEVMTEIAEHGVAVRDTYYIGEDREPFTLIWFGTHMSSCPINELTKTGRRFPQIAEVLKQMNRED